MSKLQEIYIKKYISSRYYETILKESLHKFEELYEKQTSIIDKDTDLVIFLMKKKEFQGLIRYTIVTYNNYNDKKLVFNEIDKLLNKQEIINMYSQIDPLFKVFLVASLYSYI